MKGPPTEADLLQLGKSQTLDKVISLDLTRRSLTNIDVELFNQLTSLQTLDVSQNLLTTIPDELRLPKLRVLDCSDNQLDSVRFVKNLRKLEELYIEDNDNVMLDDYYIAKVLCPSLRSIDGGGDLLHVQKGVAMYKNELQPAIDAVWEAKFAEVYSEGVGKSEMASLHREFVDTINNSNIVGANLTLPKFKPFMIEYLSWKLLETVNSGQHKQGRRGKQQGTSSTPGRYGTRVASGITPVKDYSSGTPVNKDGAMTDATPSRKRKRDDTPDNSTVTSPSAKRKKERHDTPAFTILKPSTDMEHVQLPELEDYDPSLFVRCHSKGNNPADDETKVWRCAFEPLIDGRPGETSNILATCGGKIVCLIDCQTGKIVRRYKDSSKSESFYALAWTTLKSDDTNLKEDVNILAVAGQNECIKLIHPTQLVMFGSLIGHRGYISSLVFHPSQPNILFSGSRDSRIIMWQIGTPDFKDFSIKWSQLAVLSLPKTDAITIIVQPDLDLLVAGCETSCYAWKIDKLKHNKKSEQQSPHYEFIHPVEDSSEEETTVDGLALLPNNCIVTKCVGHSRLYVWDLKEHAVKRKSKLQRVTITPLVQLQYRPVEVDYLYPSTCGSVVSVGDDKGNILMFNLASVLKHKIHSDQLLQASRVLEYPSVNVQKEFEEKMKDVTEAEGEVVINCVSRSSSGEYVASGTDTNLICIWKKASL